MESKEELIKEHESIDNELFRELKAAFRNEILHSNDGSYYKGYSDAMKLAYQIFSRQTESDLEDVEFLEKQEAVNSEYQRYKVLAKQYDEAVNQ